MYLSWKLTTAVQLQMVGLREEKCIQRRDVIFLDGKGEGQLQTNAADNEAPAEDINHSNAEEQPLPVALAVTLVLQRFSRDHQPSKRYNAQESLAHKFRKTRELAEGTE